MLWICILKINLKNDVGKQFVANKSDKFYEIDEKTAENSVQTLLSWIF